MSVEKHENKHNIIMLFSNVCISWHIALKIEELQEALRKKEEEMKQMEERYKKYLEKAKSVSTCVPC